MKKHTDKQMALQVENRQHQEDKDKNAAYKVNKYTMINHEAPGKHVSSHTRKNKMLKRKVVKLKTNEDEFNTLSTLSSVLSGPKQNQSTQLTPNRDNKQTIEEHR